MEKIFVKNQKPVIEHLIFEKEGRAHQHAEFESFFVLCGSGQVIYGDTTIEVSEGDLVTIPPRTLHRMIPAEYTIMEGFLWYHSVLLNVQH